MYYNAINIALICTKNVVCILCKLYKERFYYSLICLYYYIFKQIYRNCIFSCFVLIIFGPQQFLTLDPFPLFCVFSSCFLSCGTCGIYFNIKIIVVSIFGLLKYLSCTSWKRRRRFRLQSLKTWVWKWETPKLSITIKGV